MTWIRDSWGLTSSLCFVYVDGCRSQLRGRRKMHRGCIVTPVSTLAHMTVSVGNKQQNLFCLQRGFIQRD